MVTDSDAGCPRAIAGVMPVAKIRMLERPKDFSGKETSKIPPVAG